MECAYFWNLDPSSSSLFLFSSSSSSPSLSLSSPFFSSLQILSFLSMSGPFAVAPSLLTLPTELLLQILTYLPYPTYHLLHRTHPCFRDLITPSAIRKHILTANQIDLLASEPVLPSNIYPCYICMRALSSSRFSLSSRKDDRVHAGSKALKRFCVDCGAKARLYFPGQQIEMDDGVAKICRHCLKFVRGGKIELGSSCRGHEERGRPRSL